MPGPPGAVSAPVAPEDADGTAVVTVREVATGSEPVVPYCVCLTGVEEDAELEQFRVTGRFRPADHACCVVDRLTRRLQIVAALVTAASGSPAVTGVRVQRPQEREQRIVAARCGVADQQVDHRPECARPLTVAFISYRGGFHDGHVLDRVVVELTVMA